MTLRRALPAALLIGVAGWLLIWFQTEPRANFDSLIYHTHALEYAGLDREEADANLTLVSNEVGQTVRTMTAVTAILMLDALIAGIYGMNFDPEFSPLNMPELRWYFGYPFALGMMLVATVILIAFFRWRKWL